MTDVADNVWSKEAYLPDEQTQRPEQHVEEESTHVKPWA